MGYGVKIFLSSPPNYVTRSAGYFEVKNNRAARATRISVHFCRTLQNNSVKRSGLRSLRQCGYTTAIHSFLSHLYQASYKIHDILKVIVQHVRPTFHAIYSPNMKWNGHIFYGIGKISVQKHSLCYSNVPTTGTKDLFFRQPMRL